MGSGYGQVVGKVVSTQVIIPGLASLSWHSGISLSVFYRVGFVACATINYMLSLEFASSSQTFGNCMERIWNESGTNLERIWNESGSESVGCSEAKFGSILWCFCSELGCCE